MNLPDRCRELLLSDRDPADIYRLCLQEQPGPEALQAVVYGVEMKFALEALKGKPRPLSNFGDLDGTGDRLLWRVLDPLPRKRVAFLGSGPYPVTALLVKERYPESEVLCVDRDVVGYLVGKAVAEALGLELEFRLQDAHEVDCRDFDLVVVAAMVAGKEELARKLLEATEARLIVRGQVGIDHPRVYVGCTDSRWSS